MKAWGWISMRRSLGDAVKNVFRRNHNEECANWPILELQMKKMSPKLEFTRKTEQNRPCWKFWLLVKSQRKSQSQLVHGQSQQILVQVGSEFPGWVTGRVVELLMSSYDMSLMWIKADVDVLAWLLTWSDDVIIWCRMTSAAVSTRGRSVQCSPAREEAARNPGGAWWHV